MQDYVKKQVLVAICAYMGQILVGAAFGWSAPAIPILQDPETSPLRELITDEQASWVGSMVYVGSILGPQLSGYLSNRRGRKACLIFGGVTALTGYVILATSVNFTMIIVSRTLTGLGVGIIHVINFVYLGEISSTNIRGIILTGSAIFTTIGILMTYSTVPFMPYVASSCLLVAFAVVYIAGFSWVPETPVFLVLKGRDDEARQILTFLGRTDPKDVAKVLSAKQEKVSTVASGWKELYQIRGNRKALLITLTLNTLQELSGAMVVLLFATTIFRMAGSTIDYDIATIIIGCTQLVGTMITPIFVERTGRKILLLISTGFCCLSLTTLGLYFFLDDAGYDVTNVGWLPLVCLISFFLAYDLGLGIIPPAYIGEMFTSAARGPGSGVVTTSAWSCGFAASTAFGYLVASIGGGPTFWLFATACAVAFVFTLLVVPETKGKSLFEIQEMLNR